MTLVDSNVLIDLVTDDPRWASWSQAQLEGAALNGPLHINDTVYAETSTSFSSVDAFEAMLENAQLSLVPTPRAALFLAGKAFQQYRRAGGLRTGVLADFLIGAHAAVMGWPLLTRDAWRYRSYFPTLVLIAPD